METLKEGEAIIKITADKYSMECEGIEVEKLIYASNKLIVDFFADSKNVSKKEAAQAIGTTLLLTADNFEDD